MGPTHRPRRDTFTRTSYRSVPWTLPDHPSSWMSCLHGIRDLFQKIKIKKPIREGIRRYPKVFSLKTTRRNSSSFKNLYLLYSSFLGLSQSMDRISSTIKRKGSRCTVPSGRILRTVRINSREQNHILFLRYLSTFKGNKYTGSQR